jgi:hypothetical protein
MENVQTGKKPMRKWPFILLTVLLAIGGTGYYFYNRYIANDHWKPILQKQLEDLVLNSSDSLYHITYSDFDLNITSGNATLSDFKLIPDKTVYNRMVAQKKAPDNLFTLSVKKLVIKNVGAKKAYQEKILNIDNITIEKPDLTIENKRYAFNDTVKVGKPKTPYEIIKKVFKQLRIDSIALKDISLNYINKNNAVVKRNALKHLDIGISDIVIDSLSNRDTSRFYYTKGVQLVLHDYKLATADSMYYIKLKKILFSTSERKIVLEKVAFTPRYSKASFHKVLGHPAERFDISFNKITLTDIDLQRFLRDQKVYAGTMDINKGKVEIYNNNAYKGKKKSKIGKDPHQQLQKVALDLWLKRLNLRNTTITYAEADAKSGYTGIINFNNTNGYFLNVTNDPAVKRVNPYMTANINTSFLGTAALNVRFKFNLVDKAGAFNYSGTLGRFNGQKMDKLVKPLAMVHVKSADVEKLSFNVNASNYSGKGALQFYYKNLNVELLKKEEGKAGLQKQGFISKLANTLIIEDSNPDKKGKFRPGPINLKREPTVSFFSFLYKALLDGLKPSVGFDAKTENRVNKAIEKVTSVVNTFNNIKENIKKRREERKKKKAIEKIQKEKEDAIKKIQKEKEEAAKKAAEKDKQKQKEQEKNNTP